jgi:ATP-dependent DNA ligase
MDEGRTGDLVFYAFDLLFLDGTSTMELPLIERKARLEPLFATAMPGLLQRPHHRRW